MKIAIKSLNSCLQRRFNIDKYKDIIKKSQHKYTKKFEEADRILIWSCAFREDFCKNSIEKIKEFSNTYGKEKIIVCGCLPSINENILKEHFEGDYFEWKNETEGFKKFFNINIKKDKVIIEKNITNNIEKYKKKYPSKNVSYYDQFIKIPISEGCSHNCIYCAEKLAFPEYKSFFINKIISKCKKTIKSTNNKNIILIADSLGDYGKDINSSLKELTKNLLNIDENIKIGYMNIHPLDFFNDINFFTKLIEEKKLFHLSLPIQSANDRIINLMNRNYNKKTLEYIFDIVLNKLNFKELETHLIVGFPSETDEEFKESIKFILDYKPKYVMVSGYMDSNRIEASNLKHKLKKEEISKKILKAANIFKKNNIICNYDNCEYFKERINKL